MPTLTIKKFPARLHARLKRQAAEHRRSMNSEAIECLQNGLVTAPIAPDEFLARVREHRNSLTGIWVTEKDLKKAKNWGRL